MEQATIQAIEDSQTHQKSKIILMKYKFPKVIGHTEILEDGLLKSMVLHGQNKRSQRLGFCNKTLINSACEKIFNGEIRASLIVGGEASLR